jgi:hypothetical protein
MTPTIADIQAQVAAVNAAAQQVLAAVFSLNETVSAFVAAQVALLFFNTPEASQYLAVLL